MESLTAYKYINLSIEESGTFGGNLITVLIPAHFTEEKLQDIITDLTTAIKRANKPFTSATLINLFNSLGIEEVKTEFWGVKVAIDSQ